ncbi:hypothetical protein SAMN05660464_3417 [Geodermatophilus dictyosporus]|uniref:Uncharacterized protein n=1 Tax=Geodermatophilus dictyosporus TaxID=1523247 RepID=A0A1I5R0T9_9ACTN|nr:hypothetical protein [Geodermatophilus dictyosporus]SFP52128.1 hypothetical protein SAMN05660464_3417 [Geodermatophilus dictyosporus]
MPIWTVQSTSGEDEEIEAGLLATESGALVALSHDGLLTRAWAPGQWRTVRQVTHVEGHPVSPVDEEDALLIGLPRG